MARAVAMPEYTLLAAASIPMVLLVEFGWLRTGLFRQLRYWLALAIVVFFQVLVDGFLTKSEGTIVSYYEPHISGVRVGWNTPIEDFAFGFSLVTATLLLWVRSPRRRAREEER